MSALILATWLTAATAGTVRVETSVATEVRQAGVPVVKIFGPGTVRQPEVDAGPQAFEVFRYGRPRAIVVDVPATGTVRILVGEDTLTTDTPPAPAPDAAPPKVLLRAADGQRFSILIDGERTALLHAGQPLLLDGLEAAGHSLEVRSIDNHTIWSKGTLDLKAGEELQITIAEGRLPEVFGRAEAWRPK